jgi:transposase
MEIRLLCDHRGDLVADRTGTVKSVAPASARALSRARARGQARRLNQARVLDRVDRRLQRLSAGARVRVAREQVAHLRRLNRHSGQLKRELLELVRAHRPQPLAETGCGPLVAAILIGRTAGAQRLRSDASFALQSGTAPIPCSSGTRSQHRLNRGGDRHLDHALHIIAATRANHDPATKAYLERKEAEGKTKKGALRRLKRHLARRFHHPLAPPAETPHRDPSNGPTVHADPPRPDARNIVGAAPAPIPRLS